MRTNQHILCLNTCSCHGLKKMNERNNRLKSCSLGNVVIKFFVAVIITFHVFWRLFNLRKIFKQRGKEDVVAVKGKYMIDIKKFTLKDQKWFSTFYRNDLHHWKDNGEKIHKPKCDVTWIISFCLIRQYELIFKSINNNKLVKKWLSMWP